MSFNLQVSFTGICAFFSVPGTSDDDPVSICVVMPGGSSGFRALDDELLCRHNAYLSCALDSQGPQLPAIDLAETQVFFQGLGRSAVSFPSAPAGTSDLADLTQVISGSLPFDPRITGVDPPRVVNSQVWLTAGELTYPQTTDPWQVKPVPSGLPGDPAGISEGLLAHSVIWTVTGLEDLRLQLASFRGSKRIISLKPDQPANLKTVRLSIVNSCRYGQDLPLVLDTALRDRDFKWYYELLTRTARNDIQTALAATAGDLPIPRFVSEGSNVSGGADCYPVKAGTIPFS